MKLWPCGFKIEYTHRGFASAVAVWLGIWSSDHVVLKSSICTSASPWQQRSHWGLRMTKDAYFSLLTHSKQLLIVSFCDLNAGIVEWDRTTQTTINAVRTNRPEVWNNYVDISKKCTLISSNFTVLIVATWHKSLIRNLTWDMNNQTVYCNKLVMAV